MDIHYIDLTDEVFENYTSCEGIVTLYFGNIGIQMDFLQFKRLKDIILLNEQLSEECRQYEFKEQKPSKETLLKELRKTIDKIVDLTTRYDSTYFALMEERVSPRFIDVLEVKDELRPMLEKRNKLMRYKEELEAQLEYGDLK